LRSFKAQTGRERQKAAAHGARRVGIFLRVAELREEPCVSLRFDPARQRCTARVTCIELQQKARGGPSSLAVEL
jgi:hypothetical protein